MITTGSARVGASVRRLFEPDFLGLGFVIVCALGGALLFANRESVARMLREQQRAETAVGAPSSGLVENLERQLLAARRDAGAAQTAADVAKGLVLDREAKIRETELRLQRRGTELHSTVTRNKQVEAQKRSLELELKDVQARLASMSRTTAVEVLLPKNKRLWFECDGERKPVRGVTVRRRRGSEIQKRTRNRSWVDVPVAWQNINVTVERRRGEQNFALTKDKYVRQMHLEICSKQIHP